MFGLICCDLGGRIENLKKSHLPTIKIKKTLYFSFLLITLHRLKSHTSLITFEKPMETIEKTLIGTKTPSPITTSSKSFNLA